MRRKLRGYYRINRLRVLMKKGEAKLLPLNLNDLANDVLELARTGRAQCRVDDPLDARSAGYPWAIVCSCSRFF